MFTGDLMKVLEQFNINTNHKSLYEEAFKQSGGA